MKEITKTRYKSTPAAMRDFMQSAVWHDMLLELNGAVEQLRDSLEIAKDFESVLRYQECLDTIRRVIVMPSVIISDMEDITENETFTEGEE